MSKICLIRQPAGLGDILFCQKIAYELAEKYGPVLWPVNSAYTLLYQNVANKSPRVTFIDEGDVFPYKDVYLSDQIQISSSDDLVYIPLQHADKTAPTQSYLMSKYKFVGLDFADWKDYFTIKRNAYREEQLFKRKIKQSTPYIVVNTNYGTFPNTITRDFDIVHRHIIPMGFDREYTLFDWLGILEKAEHIYTVETSLCFILSKLGFRNVTVLARSPSYVPNYQFDYLNLDQVPHWSFEQ